VNSIPRVRPIKSLVLLKILQKYYGYSARQGAGDHIVLFDSKGHHTIIQTGKELHPGIIRSILRETGLEWKDIEKYL
jgi:predicted RNA binding protein YcfA (HicA-like mRNA interferase family)